MNSINWPASSIWVFIARLGEHYSTNAEATGSNPVEAPKNLFFGLFLQLLKLRFTAMVTYSFHLYSRSSHHFIQCRPHLSHFCDPNLLTFCLCIYLFKALNSFFFFFAENRHIFAGIPKSPTSTCQNFLSPKIPKKCDPILVTVLKMQPHYSQSSRENATPSSDTSHWAVTRKYPPPPPPLGSQ